jgi:hypothetical protein
MFTFCNLKINLYLQQLNIKNTTRNLKLRKIHGQMMGGSFLSRSRTTVFKPLRQPYQTPKQSVSCRDDYVNKSLEGIRYKDVSWTEPAQEILHWISSCDHAMNLPVPQRSGFQIQFPKSLQRKRISEMLATH